MLENQDQVANDDTNATLEVSTEEKLYGPDAEEAGEDEGEKEVEAKEEQSEGEKEESSEEEKTEEEPKEGEEDKKDSEEEGEPEGAPESYELEVDDSLIDEEVLEQITDFAKESNLSNSEAQEFLKMQENAVASFRDRTVQKHEADIESWAKEIENDKTYGLDNYKENADRAYQVSHKYGTEGFRKMMDQTGFGNHPEIFKTFANIGKAMSNDKLVTSNQESKPQKSIADKLYGQTE